MNNREKNSLKKSVSTIKHTLNNKTKEPNCMTSLNGMTHLISRLSTFPSAIMISSLVANVSVGSPGMSPPGRTFPRLYHSP
jgi:hypothetical protein